MYATGLWLIGTSGARAAWGTRRRFSADGCVEGAEYTNVAGTVEIYPASLYCVGWPIPLWLERSSNGPTFAL